MAGFGRFLPVRFHWIVGIGNHLLTSAFRECQVNEAATSRRFRLSCASPRSHPCAARAALLPAPIPHSRPWASGRE